MRQSDKRQMALALKGAPDAIKQLFFSAMTERSAKLMREDMAGMAPLRTKDGEEAQTVLVRLAKQLADSGEILIADDALAQGDACIAWDGGGLTLDAATRAAAIP